MAEGLTAKELAFVSAYIGEARGNATKAAEIAGYSKKTAYSAGGRLLKDVEVQAAIEAWRAEVKVSAITDLSYRVSRLSELEQRMWQVVDARQKAYADTEVIGGESGIVVLQHKAVGSGPSAEIVDEYVADTALVKAIQGVYDDVAKELGQRTTNLNVSGELGIRRYIGVDPEAV